MELVITETTRLDSGWVQERREASRGLADRRDRTKPPPVPTSPRGSLTVVPPELPLLELEKELVDRPLLSAIAGVTESGLPLICDLDRPETSHVLVVGPRGWGKSTLLRTLASSLCLRTRPWQLGVLGIDLDGRELSFLDAVPHRLSSIAHDPDEASSTLEWLESEIASRVQQGRREPALILVLDDLAWLADPDQAVPLKRMKGIFDHGARAGVHALGAANELPPGLEPLLQSRGSVIASAPAEGGQGHSTVGVFRFRVGEWSRLTQAASLSASDLNQVVDTLVGRQPRRAVPSGVSPANLESV